MQKVTPLIVKEMKKIVLPLDELEVSDGELIMIRGGFADRKRKKKDDKKNAGVGCGCDCQSGDDGGNAHEGVMSDPGCDCAGGAGCGCGCSGKKKSSDDSSGWKWV